MPCKPAQSGGNWFKQFGQLTADVNKYGQELARAEVAVVVEA